MHSKDDMYMFAIQFIIHFNLQRQYSLYYRRELCLHYISIVKSNAQIDLIDDENEREKTRTVV